MTQGPVVWMTGEYPRATDTFIQREVAALRALGLDVRTVSIRRTGAEHLVGPEQRAEQAGTWHVLEAARRPLTLIAALGDALTRAPGRALGALALAWRTAAPGLRGHLYAMIYLAEALVLARHLRAIGARHLHNHIAKASGTVAMLTAALTGIPQSFTLHGPDDLWEPGLWRLDEKIARAAFVLCISRFCRSQAMLFSDPRHWPRLHVVHCGVDPARYDAGPPGRDLLFVGRLAAVKGVPVLLRALAAARRIRPDLRLTLVGDGPEAPALRRLVGELGLTEAVRFAGALSQGEVARALADHAALVLPSFAEGLPVVLMEALAARRPVIATQVAGVPELVEHGVTGLLVPPGDEAALTDAILRLTGAPEAAARMGEAGRARVLAEFDARIEAARILAILQGSTDIRPEPARGIAA